VCSAAATSGSVTPVCDARASRNARFSAAHSPHGPRLCFSRSACRMVCRRCLPVPAPKEARVR
jgi:hypothetical protein